MKNVSLSQCSPSKFVYFNLVFLSCIYMDMNFVFRECFEARLKVVKCAILFAIFFLFKILFFILLTNESVQYQLHNRFDAI